jgi:hypothetical protein
MGKAMIPNGVARRRRDHRARNHFVIFRTHGPRIKNHRPVLNASDDWHRLPVPITKALGKRLGRKRVADSHKGCRKRHARHRSSTDRRQSVGDRTRHA